MSRSFHPPRMSVPEGSLPIAFGEVLAGKYRVDQLLGLGGMAVVLSGTHIELDAPIAIKVLLPARAGNPDAVRRFLTEARAAAKLTGANVARISDVGTAETTGGVVLPFIVMERLDGVDLATLMETRKRLSVDEALDFVRQAALGLAEAHALKIVHRDIKPANLFLTRARDGVPVVKVLDFGISKTISAMSAQHERAITKDKEVMGSPGYMSPEQVRAEKGIDERTDIWSLGVVLHELVTGRDAFAGDALHEIFASILHAEPTEIDDDVPAEVKAIVRRCLEKDPARRYQTVGELVHALARAVDRPAGMPARPLAGRGPIIAAAAAALVFLGGGFAIFARSRAEDVSATPAALSLESAIAIPAAPPAPVQEPSGVDPTPAELNAEAPAPEANAEAPAGGAAKPSRPATRPAAPAASGPTPSAKPPSARKRTEW